MTELDRLGWAVRKPYEMAGGRFAIRCTSESFGLWLDDVLGRYRTEGDALTRYSIVIADPPDGGVTKERYHILYRGTIALIRTTSRDAVARMLLGDLESFFLPDREDAMYADMVPVSVDGVTALVPEVLVPFIGTLGNRRVSRVGLRLPMETSVGIDATGGRIHPISQAVEADLPSPDGEGDVATDRDASGRATLEGPTRVDVLISIGWGDESIQPVSKGLALYRLASHVANLWSFGERGLLSLQHLVEGARCYEMASKKPAEMLQTIVATLQKG
jgi:hypothetical protein